MSRRCKPGQRARVICSGANKGKIVVVVRHYFGEEVDGATWAEYLYPWVATSLGAPLWWRKEKDSSVRGASMTIVLDDSALEPLDDDDDGLLRSSDQERPIVKSTPGDLSLVSSREEARHG